MDMDMRTNRNPVAGTALDDLLAEAEEVVRPKQPVDVPVARLGWVLKCLPVVSPAQTRRWTSTSLVKTWRANQPEGMSVDQVTYAALMIAETCVAIHRADGTLVTDDSGEPVTFRSPSKSKLSNADRVKAVFKADEDAGISLMEAAGIITEALGDSDPSRSSSTG